MGPKSQATEQRRQTMFPWVETPQLLVGLFRAGARRAAGDETTRTLGAWPEAYENFVLGSLISTEPVMWK